MQTPVREREELKLPMHKRKKTDRDNVPVRIARIPMDWDTLDTQDDNDLVKRLLEAQTNDCSLVDPSFEEDDVSKRANIGGESFK